MPQIHLVIGAVGAGKSTYANSLCQKHGAVLLNLDEWMTRLFRADRPDENLIPWYTERTARCIDVIWTLIHRLLRANTPIVLEIGLILRADRERFYAKIDEHNYPLDIHVIEAPHELRKKRVQQRNLKQGSTFSMVVPPHIFEMASSMWEAPDAQELDGRSVHFMDSNA